MNLFAKLALAREIAQAEQAVLRLLGGIETGVATGRTAEAYRSAIRRHGRTILDAGGPQALAAAMDRISDVPGRRDERRAVLTKLWADLEGIRE
ncbi:hypothetical protein GOFOIKOB_6285 [Methylobacterium tardum]|uniref:Uncharacterized protein n=1 Tax=Methylobacterium tardum TaxID=374432 RepID=A0AA37WVI2_9HYPH|nr:hypothetical protein [Methylobacterium tardum]URD40305.1 hypothetical protein M6G65_33190 [Methylobacterium tardum]GJE53209.1 hypothetical protein GOFOIKOB_6285 [Methylobacterium tardum]GLS74634.1 hypothetical protein GCM10007890_66520 [Methylobacterium tardum]